MSVILVHVPVEQGTPRRAALEVLSEAVGSGVHGGNEVVAALIGSGTQDAAAAVSDCGPSRLVLVEVSTDVISVNSGLLSVLSAVIAEVKPAHVLFSSSETVKDVLGALAVKTGASVLPDVVSFTLGDGTAEAVRPVMAAKQLGRVATAADLIFISARPGAFETVSRPREPEVVRMEYAGGESGPGPVLLETLRPSGDRVDLTEAAVVVAAGRGVRDEAGKALVEQLADLFGAGIGASRAVVETHLFPATAQIGQTGKVVSPDLYFALGISGAIQHVAGMTGSRVIVAINKDPDAPIFDVATFGIVGDLYAVVPRLIEAVRQRRSS